jgi:hypothetical protein
MYSIPPFPNFGASMAAYRRRSLSFNEPKRRFIIRSTASEYTSIGPSLIIPPALESIS